MFIPKFCLVTKTRRNFVAGVRVNKDYMNCYHLVCECRCGETAAEIDKRGLLLPALI